MNGSVSCLTPERLRQLETDELSPPELEELEAHLSRCENCRCALEQAAAEPDWRQEVRDALADASGPEDWSGLADCLAKDEPQDACGAVEHFLKLLGPTDDPRMLGRIGPYEIVGILGRGGMGVVFKGFDGALHRYVAIKMLLPHLAASGAARKRFAREAQAAAAVVHDHVMAIHAVAEWQGAPYLVMPYGRGVSLQKRLDDQGPLELREILRIGMQTAAGLAAAHAQGLVHRDVKPANILLDEGVERVTLTDFGLARAVDDASLTRIGVLAGTPQYMSPEQAGGKAVDARSDLFSLGSVLYAMCAGRAPFRADSSYGVLRLIMDDEPPPIREINPDIPEWLCALVARLLSKRAADRFESAAEVAELLEACLAHVQQPAAAPLPACLVPHTTGRRWVFKSRGRGAVAVVGALGIALLGMALWQASEAPEIGGNWTGDDWGSVVLEPGQPGQYRGRYNGADPVRSGAMQLKWSRVERRFNGAWEEAEDRNGKISLRLVGDEIRGAWTTNKNSKTPSGTPRLGDLSWSRAEHAVSPSVDPQSLAAAARQFNADTAEARSKLFAPPIPDLTVERLREGFRRTAELYRRLGKRQVADALEQIAKSGRLPNEASHVIGSGIHAKDKFGETISQQVVPGLILPDDTTSTGNSLVVLQPLELVYIKDGYVSKDYGDSYGGEVDRLEGVWEAVLPPEIAAKIPEDRRSRLVFAGDWIGTFEGSRRIAASRFKIELQHAPRRISGVDLRSIGKRLRGIYEVKDDGLRLSLAPDTEAMPERFATEHPEFKRVTGELAQEQFDALKRYSKQATTGDAGDAGSVEAAGPERTKQNWCLELLEEESNLEALNAALTALNQVGGEGQEPRLAKATLRALGRMYDVLINMNHDDDLDGSLDASIMEIVEKLTGALVKQPSDTVVEALLSVAGEKTRSLGSRFALLTILDGILDDERRGEVEAPFGHLREKVAERANDLVSVLVETRKARQDPEGPAFVSALHVVKISNRKIADFEGLEPFIAQQLARGSFRMGADRAFAEFLLDIDPDYPGLVKFMLRLLRNAERDNDHADLTPLLPRFGDRAKLFVPELAKMLQMRSKQAFDAGTSKQVFIQGGKARQLAEALGTLGALAEDALSILREVSATPQPTDGAFSEASKIGSRRQYDQSVEIINRLRQAADNAIEQIEDSLSRPTQH